MISAAVTLANAVGNDTVIVRSDVTGRIATVTAASAATIACTVLCRVRTRNIGAGVPFAVAGSAFGPIAA
jgi:hypothetical protein